MKTKLFLIACALLAGCDIHRGESGAFFSKTYITAYMMPESFALPYIYSNGKYVYEPVIKPNDFICIQFYGEIVTNKNNSALFNSIAKRIGDKNWNN